MGPYSPTRISNSRAVPAILTRYLWPAPITYMGRQLPAVPISCLQGLQSPAGHTHHLELPGKLRHLRHLQFQPVRPECPYRECCPSCQDPKTDRRTGRLGALTVPVTHSSTFDTFRLTSHCIYGLCGTLLEDLRIPVFRI